VDRDARAVLPGVHGRVTGNVIENVAPRAGLFAAAILPPWRSMMERQIERPIPSVQIRVAVDDALDDADRSVQIDGGNLPHPVFRTPSVGPVAAAGRPPRRTL
jgi:hypothetical protein